jgi:hypothetical protein
MKGIKAVNNQMLIENLRYVNVLGNKIETLHIRNKGIPIVLLTGLGCTFYDWWEVIFPLK